MNNQRERSHKYYVNHKEEILKKKKLYNRLHNKEISQQRRQYYLKNKKRFSRLHIRYMKLHAVEVAKYKKMYEATHKTEKKNYNAVYYQTNKKQINKNRNKQFINRKRTDIKFKLRCYLRSRMNSVLKGNPKFKTTMKLTGCSITDLKKHLENQFKQGMNWNNYGYRGWHIDHIKPCCSFDLSKPEEQRKCFHYTNLQPLWAKDNLKKGSKYAY